MVVGEDVVRAVYHALLGHPPDPEGLAYWTAAGSVPHLVEALLTTDRFAERAAAFAVTPGAEAAAGALAAARLHLGRGLVELADLPPTVAPFAGLDVLPWEVVGSGAEHGSWQVVGRYAVELAAEALRRGVAREAWAGVEDGPAARRADVLVLTGTGDLAGLRWARPDVLRGARRRVAVPVQADTRRPADEVAASCARVRAGLHAVGLTQVRHVVGGRHGAAPVVVDVSSATPDPGRLTTTLVDGVPDGGLPPVSWLVGDRAPVVDRP